MTGRTANDSHALHCGRNFFLPCVCPVFFIESIQAVYPKDDDSSELSFRDHQPLRGLSIGTNVSAVKLAAKFCHLSFHGLGSGQCVSGMRGIRVPVWIGQLNTGGWPELRLDPKKILVSIPPFPHHARVTRVCPHPMKAKIIITPKKAVLDPQGKTVQNALEHMGYGGIAAVHVGKYLEIELTGTDREKARQQLDEASHRFLSNPVIEDYKLEIE
jgi:phosphoribosylformylglycinamidine synthase